MKREYFRNMFKDSYQRQAKKFMGEKIAFCKEIDDPALSGESNIMAIEWKIISDFFGIGEDLRSGSFISWVYNVISLLVSILLFIKFFI